MTTVRELGWVEGGGGGGGRGVEVRKLSETNKKYTVSTLIKKKCLSIIGVIKREFLLSTQPVEGNWKISVSAAEVRTFKSCLIFIIFSKEIICILHYFFLQ